MATKQKYTLGEAVPDSPHSVISNLPTLADVCAYEEKADYVAEAMGQGYPRFVEHRWVRVLAERMAADVGVPAVSALAVHALTEGMRASVIALDSAIQCHHFDLSAYGLALDLLYVDPETCSPEAEAKLKAFVQRTGCRISSRIAESVLCDLGYFEGESEEVGLPKPIDASAIEEAERAVSERIAHLCGLQSSGPISITASGMNAFYAAFKAMQSVQLARGRSQWLQLGWLYVDSGHILRKYLSEEESLSVEYAISDTEAILSKIESLGEALSVVVLEFPTNPFCELADLKRISEAVWAQGGLVLIDPSIVSVYNVNCLPYADVVVSSLTKYAAHSGDVMAGAVVLNAASSAYAELKEGIERNAIPLYGADLLALQTSMRGAELSVECMNENTRRLVDFLKRHPKITKVFSVSENQQHRSYLKHEHANGSIISVELKGSMEAFYDRVQLVKGPSFGTDFTIVCPYFYLAHYDLVLDTSPNNLCDRLGMDRNLIRISVGCEPVEELLSALASALDAL